MVIRTCIPGRTERQIRSPWHRCRHQLLEHLVAKGEKTLTLLRHYFIMNMACDTEPRGGCSKQPFSQRIARDRLHNVLRQLAAVGRDVRRPLVGLLIDTGVYQSRFIDVNFYTVLTRAGRANLGEQVLGSQ